MLIQLRTEKTRLSRRRVTRQRARFLRTARLLFSGVALLLLTAEGRAYAGTIQPSDCVPPPAPYLTEPPGDEILFPGTPVIIRKVKHFAFTDCFPPPGPGVPSTEQFGSTLQAEVSTDGGTSFISIEAAALVTVIVTFKEQIGETRFFDTEMVQLDISGGSLPPGVMIQESPTLDSKGETRITDIGGGRWRIDSFFDVFIELTLDGTNFIPADGAHRVRVVPEPSSLLILGLGLGMVGRFARSNARRGA